MNMLMLVLNNVGAWSGLLYMCVFGGGYGNGVCMMTRVRARVVIYVVVILLLLYYIIKY